MRYVDKDMSRRRKRSRSILLDSWLLRSTTRNSRWTLSSYLDIDVHRRGRWKPRVRSSGYTTALMGTHLQWGFMRPHRSFIYNNFGIGQCLLRLNPYAWSYIPVAMMSQGYLIGAPIFQPSTGTSSSTSSGASTNQDSIKEYPEIGGIISWNAATEAHSISMVGPARAPSLNSSSRYPTIRESKVFDRRTPSNRVV
jgi:hypothetical protein